MDLHFPEPLTDFVRQCEVECVVTCCGIQAYDVSHPYLARWGHAHGLSAMCEAATQLESQLTAVARSSGAVVSDEHLFNQIWATPADCLAYFVRLAGGSE